MPNTLGGGQIGAEMELRRQENQSQQEGMETNFACVRQSGYGGAEDVTPYRLKNGTARSTELSGESVLESAYAPRGCPAVRENLRLLSRKIGFGFLQFGAVGAGGAEFREAPVQRFGQGSVAGGLCRPSATEQAVETVRRVL